MGGSGIVLLSSFENKDSIRKRDLITASTLLGMTDVEYYDIELRKHRDTIEKPWLPIPYSDLDSAYNRVSAAYHIENFIKKITRLLSLLWTIS
jgi:hypothetical protein